jgi:hypothetical protein
LAGNLARSLSNIEQRSCHRQACGTRLVSSVITAGIFGIVAAPFISRLLPLFPPGRDWHHYPGDRDLTDAARKSRRPMRQRRRHRRGTCSR